MALTTFSAPGILFQILDLRLRDRLLSLWKAQETVIINHIEEICHYSTGKILDMTLHDLEVDILTWRDVTKEMLMLECPEMEKID